MALDKFEIIRRATKMMHLGSTRGIRGYTIKDLDLSGCKEVRIKEADLINAGVPSDYFINVIPPHLRNTINTENYHMLTKRYLIFYKNCIIIIYNLFLKYF